MNYDFSELTKRLDKLNKAKQSKAISFSQINPKIKQLMIVTDNQLDYAIKHRKWKRPDEPLEDYDDEEIDEIASLLDKHDNFSEIDDNAKFAKLTNCLKQNDLSVNKSGICLLISLYNAYPWIFLNDKRLLESLIDYLDEDTYAKPEKVMNLINNRLSKMKSREILKRPLFKRFKDGALDEIKITIDKGIATTLGYDYNDSGHNITVIGYGKDYLYYIDNNDETVDKDTMLFLDVMELFIRSLYYKYKKKKAIYRKKAKYIELYKLLDDLYEHIDTVNLNDFYSKVAKILKPIICTKSNYSNIKYGWLNHLHNIDLLILNNAVVSTFSDSRY